MSKERFSYEEFNDSYCIRDNERDVFLNVVLVTNMLNDNHKRIAELEEQLKNAIVLPIKNNKIYYILHSQQEIIEYDICSLKVDSFRTNDYDSWLMSEYGKNWFSTKEEAQAKLKQLKGEKDET